MVDCILPQHLLDLDCLRDKLAYKVPYLCYNYVGPLCFRVTLNE